MTLSYPVRHWRWVNDERLQPLGLTQSRWITLSHLKYQDRIQQHQLACMVGVESPSWVRTLDELEQLDLVERRPCPQGRRGKRVYLTPKAAPLMAVLFRRFIHCTRCCLRVFPCRPVALLHLADQLIAPAGNGVKSIAGQPGPAFFRPRLPLPPVTLTDSRGHNAKDVCGSADTLPLAILRRRHGQRPAPAT